VRQYKLICFGDLLKAFFSSGRWVPVGMIFQRQPPVGGFDFLFRGSGSQPQELIGIVPGQRAVFAARYIKKAVRREDGQL
jgi:hypothetical protein